MFSVQVSFMYLKKNHGNNPHIHTVKQCEIKKSRLHCNLVKKLREPKVGSNLTAPLPITYNGQGYNY